MPICENCKKKFEGKVHYAEFTVLCDECKMGKTVIDCTLLSDDLIDRVSDGLTEIDEDE